MVKKVAVFSALVVFTFGVLYVRESQKPKQADLQPTPQPTQSQEKYNCDKQEAAIKKTLADANYCETGSDCKTTSLDCPFGCYNFVNAKFDTTGVELAAKDYAQNCSTCIYDCPTLPSKDDIVCQNNRCIDARSQTDS